MEDPGQGYWDERLRVPWWWHPAALVFVLLIGTEVAQIMTLAVLQVATYVALAAATELILWNSGRAAVRLRCGHIEVGNWRLALRQVTSVEPLVGGAVGAALRSTDEREHREIRSWVKGAVRIEVDDPQDKPVWLFSTRRPGELAGALIAARQASLAAAGPGEAPPATEGSAGSGSSSP